jgi:hypothetical protein
MSTQVYSRDALLALPAEMRKGFLSNFIQRFMHTILDAARNGKTSIVLTTEEHMRNHLNNRNIPRPYESPPTMDEIREALLEVFPDCTITYEEKWVQTGPASQVMKKGLTVDWS